MVPSPKPNTDSGFKPPPDSADQIPELAMKEPHAGQEDFHTGRGGQGNVHKDKYGGHSSKHEQDAADGPKKESLLEKAKHAMGLDKKKEGGS
jgi:hypothetical protein